MLRGQKPLALCDRCPCFGSLFPPLAALTFAASSIICVFGLVAAAPRSPYRHLELCGIAITQLGGNKLDEKALGKIEGLLLDCLKCLLQIGDQVVGILGTDGQADGVLVDALVQ